VVAGPFQQADCRRPSKEQLTGIPAPRFSLRRFARDALTGLAHGLRRLLIFLVGAVILFAVTFVPMVRTIAARHRFPGWRRGACITTPCWRGAKIGFLQARSLPAWPDTAKRTFGLGAAVAALLVVPGVNLVALGLGTTGATLAAGELDLA
jgi:uncharacterized protein involved in cysteine biosynthesis